MNAATIESVLEAWGETNELSFSDKQAIKAQDALCNAVTAAIKAIPGVVATGWEFGSAGSTYWEIDLENGLTAKLRVSNHRAGRRANENTADIVVGDDAKEIQRQLDLVAVAATEEA
jgi:hypothetical protein